MSRTTTTRLVAAVLVVAAGVESDGEQACGWLTPQERGRVAEAAGVPACREALQEASFTLDGRRWDAGGIRNSLRYAPRPVGQDVEVTVGHGAERRVFRLAPVTDGEQEEFEGADSPWRISAGAAQVAAP